MLNMPQQNCDYLPKHCENETSNLQKSQRPFDIYRRSVFASLYSGSLWAGKVLCRMNLPRPDSKKPCDNQLKKTESSLYDTQKLMEDAAKRLIDFEEEEEEPQLMEMIDGQKVANAAVTLDRTWPWQRRRHSSKIGVVLVVSVRTREVLDYEVLSLVCLECQYHEKEDLRSEGYQRWLSSHKENCQINYKGSNGEIESKGECMILFRSMENGNLKYNVMVRDGDTGSFG